MSEYAGDVGQYNTQKSLIKEIVKFKAKFLCFNQN